MIMSATGCPLKLDAPHIDDCLHSKVLARPSCSPKAHVYPQLTQRHVVSRVAWLTPRSPASSFGASVGSSTAPGPADRRPVRPSRSSAVAAAATAAAMTSVVFW